MKKYKVIVTDTPVKMQLEDNNPVLLLSHDTGELDGVSVSCGIDEVMRAVMQYIDTLSEEEKHMLCGIYGLRRFGEPGSTNFCIH